jgi:hypothetical protein
MSDSDRLAEDAAEIDAFFRASLEAGRIKRFSLLVTATHEVGKSSAASTVKTYADVIRADGKGHTIRVPSASCKQVAQCFEQARARVELAARERLRAEVARATEKKPAWSENVGAAAMQALLRDVEEALRDAARNAELGYDSATVEAKAFRTTRFFSDHRTPLARHEETLLELRCDLRFRDSPPPRLYGEDSEPERFKVRSATLESASWPDERALADLVARAASAPTF